MPLSWKGYPTHLRRQEVPIVYHDWLRMGGLFVSVYVRFANRQSHGQPE